MRLAMVARADDGGLGAQTWEAWRHLEPARTLIVYTEHNTRGRADLTRYQGAGEVRATPAAPTPADIVWLLAGMDTVWSAETFYGSGIVQTARRLGVRSVLHANPEMTRDEHADRYLVATSWRADLVPGAQVIPFPVARDRLPYRQRTEARTLYHVAGNAFYDRAGTSIVLEAAALMREPARLIMRVPGQTGPARTGRVELEWRPHHHGPYWEAWPEEADILVLPRRYAGLSLPMQEAASLGMPVVSLDIPPQDEWLPYETRVKACMCWERVPMRGGQIDVHGCDPVDLARTLDDLLADPGLVRGCSRASDAWAASISWDRQLASFRAALA